MPVRTLLVSIFLFASLAAQVNQDVSDKALYDYIKTLNKSEAVVEGLEYALTFGNDRVKNLAIEALISIQSANAYPIFNRYVAYGVETDIADSLYANEAWQIRAKCAMGLASVNNENSASRIRNLLPREDNLMVKKAMVFALGELKDKEAIDYLSDMIDWEKDESLILNIVTAMGKIGDKRCFLPLLKVRSGNYARVTKIAAQEALRTLSWN